MYHHLVIAAMFWSGGTPVQIAAAGSASPFSWHTDSEHARSKAGEFVPPPVLGSPVEPRGIERVVLRDARPYGEAEEQEVWLTRYEAVRIESPGSDTVVPTGIYLGFTCASHHLVCAFTEPAPIWAESLAEPGLYEEMVGERWTVSAAHYEDLQSSVTDVLRAVWREEGTDPSQAGQITMRPRLVAQNFGRLDVDGKPVPPDPPTNMWLIEVLGTFIEERYGAPLTTRIVLLRDGSLTFEGAVTLP